MNNNSILRRFYNFILNHWILSSIIIFLPSILLYLTSSGFYNAKNSSDTILVNTLSNYFPLFAISFLFTLFKLFGDKYNNMVKENGLLVLTIMLQSINLGKRRKLNRFYKFIKEHHDNKGINPFDEITQPSKQIKVILDNIQGTLCRLFGLNPNEIGLSVIYNTDKNNEWEWVANINVENDLQLAELVNDNNTTAHQIITGKEKLIFYPDKRKGIKENKFKPGPIDKQKKNIGSILCKDISLDQNCNYLKAVLSITTYGQQLCDEYDVESINKILEMLIPTFEYRLKLELALLYIKQNIA
ncbi:MAG: hypothetical protein K9H48_14300 [Melioribacteraceae bacterium]|nr:hypothetical protein [Melioribacteraceae bacterium]MCF8395123.1 hypothetical protein [Melioribacteraceae bacterium]MCF8420532.1 hypothetical protein [Melioribacteraceae bacterium]